MATLCLIDLFDAPLSLQFGGEREEGQVARRALGRVAHRWRYGER